MKPTFGQRIVMKYYDASREEVSGEYGPSDSMDLAIMIDKAHNAAMRSAERRWLREHGLHHRNPNRKAGRKGAKK